MAAFNKFNSFVEALAHGGHNLGSDQLTVALTNVAPAAGNSELSDLTEISYDNLSARNLARTSSGQTEGTYSLILEDLTLTASGGSVAEFRYAVIYNSTHASGLLIGFYDRGTPVTLQDGESITLDFTEAQTLLEIS